MVAEAIASSKAMAKVFEVHHFSLESSDQEQDPEEDSGSVPSQVRFESSF